MIRKLPGVANPLPLPGQVFPNKNIPVQVSRMMKQAGIPLPGKKPIKKIMFF